MSIIKNTKILAIVAIAVVIAVGAVTINSIGLTSAQEQKFMAELSSQEEVPLQIHRQLAALNSRQWDQTV
jgi:hypothetical protein